MTRFKKIVAVDETLLNEEALQQLQKLGEEVVVYHDFPQDEHIVTERIGDADCLLVSFRTPIRKSVLDACRNIQERSGTKNRLMLLEQKQRSSGYTG